MSRSWATHLRPSLDHVEIYDVPPSTAAVRLHANECAVPWPPHVAEAMAAIVRDIELTRYPDTSGRALRAVLGERHGCDPDRVVLGNGSDEIISLLLTALGGAGTRAPVMVTPTPTFVMYGHSARVLGYEVREVPLDAALQLDAPAMRAALPGASICFLARPNNPTGTMWDPDTIASLVAAHPEIVFVVDEAYCAYAPGASLWRPSLPDNQVHMATLSKVGLAALRVGYCIADPTLAEALNKVRHPYNISATSLALACAALHRFEAEQAAMIASTVAARGTLRDMLAALPGTTVFDSGANFVLARLRDATAPSRLRAFLAEQGILIKDVSSTPGLSGCIRVGVGTQPQLARLGAALQAWTGLAHTP